MKLATLTGLLLIVVPAAFNITFLMLGRAFEYPEVLRKPTDYVLKKFKAGGASLLLESWQVWLKKQASSPPRRSTQSATSCGLSG